MNKQNSKPPREIKFLLCEDVRREELGKLILAGLFPGEIVVFHNAVADKENKLVGVLQRLCFIFILTKGSGTFDASITIETPRGAKLVDREVGRLEMIDRQSATIASVFQPFPVTEYGVHKIRLKIGSGQFDFEFEIREGESSNKRTKKANGVKAPRKTKAR